MASDKRNKNNLFRTTTSCQCKKKKKKHTTVGVCKVMLRIFFTKSSAQLKGILEEKSSIFETL